MEAITSDTRVADAVRAHASHAWIKQSLEAAPASRRLPERRIVQVEKHQRRKAQEIGEHVTGDAPAQGARSLIGEPPDQSNEEERPDSFRLAKRE
jgi:hypothetical protein